MGDRHDGGRRLRHRAAALGLPSISIPREPVPGRVKFSPSLVGFVAGIGATAAAVAVFTVRMPSDTAALIIGTVAVFLMAYAIRGYRRPAPGGVPSAVVQLGLSLTCGPLGAAGGAISESLGCSSHEQRLVQNDVQRLEPLFGQLNSVGRVLRDWDGARAWNPAATGLRCGCGDCTIRREQWAAGRRVTPFRSERDRC